MMETHRNDRVFRFSMSVPFALAFFVVVVVVFISAFAFVFIDWHFYFYCIKPIIVSKSQHFKKTTTKEERWIFEEETGTCEKNEANAGHIRIVVHRHRHHQGRLQNNEIHNIQMYAHCDFFPLATVCRSWEWEMGSLLCASLVNIHISDIVTIFNISVSIIISHNNRTDRDQHGRAPAKGFVLILNMIGAHFVRYSKQSACKSNKTIQSRNATALLNAHLLALNHKTCHNSVLTANVCSRCRFSFSFFLFFTLNTRQLSVTLSVFDMQKS